MILTGTAHSYGNKLWLSVGMEYLHVVGTKPDKQSQQSYFDYEPVTGKMLRRALRPMVYSHLYSIVKYVELITVNSSVHLLS